ncbi:MAG: hypothetical protein JXQ75_07450 [Phycisphaerae bacterium]|nr:hypothetical protein [Phycisphaerae bacterium]
MSEVTVEHARGGRRGCCAGAAGRRGGRATGCMARESRGALRRGAALLEVVLALSILLLAMSVVGGVFRNGQRSIELTERMSRAQVMTERLVVEMDTGILEMEEREQTGWFGEESIPGMSWRVEINPHETIDRLLEVDIDIYMGDPNGSEEERQQILSTRILRVEPRGLDLEEDFGLDEEQIQQLTEAIPGGAAIFDPTDFDPRMIAQLDLEQLAELLPTLIQAFGANFLGGQLGDVLQAVESGDMGALQDAAQQAGDAMQGAGDAGAASGGEQAGQGGQRNEGSETGSDRGTSGGSGTRGGTGTRGGSGTRGGGGTRQGIGDRRGGGRS